MKMKNKTSIIDRIVDCYFDGKFVVPLLEIRSLLIKPLKKQSRIGKRIIHVNVNEL
jgi:hypothetical protein